MLGGATTWPPSSAQVKAGALPCKVADRTARMGKVQMPPLARAYRGGFGDLPELAHGRFTVRAIDVQNDHPETPPVTMPTLAAGWSAHQRASSAGVGGFTW